MHFSKLATSPRLQRLLRVLQDADGELTSLELLQRAKLATLTAAISELRANGAEINCRAEWRDGQNVYLYTLIKSPENWNA